MTEEDKYLEEYRSTMKKAVLSSKQKQDLISAMKEEQTKIRGSQTQERENQKSIASHLSTRQHQDAAYYLSLNTG